MLFGFDLKLLEVVPFARSGSFVGLEALLGEESDELFKGDGKLVHDCLGEEVDNVVDVDKLVDDGLGEEVDNVVDVDKLVDEGLGEEVDNVVDIDELVDDCLGKEVDNVVDIDELVDDCAGKKADIVVDVVASTWLDELLGRSCDVLLDRFGERTDELADESCCKQLCHEVPLHPEHVVLPLKKQYCGVEGATDVGYCIRMLETLNSQETLELVPYANIDAENVCATLPMQCTLFCDTPETVQLPKLWNV